MHALAIIIGLASLASSTAIERRVTYERPQGGNDFHLQVIATAGNLTYSGQFLGTYHTGAGFNALVPYNGQDASRQEFHFDTSSGFISANLASTNYVMNLNTSNLFDPPTGYSFVGFDVIQSHNHFHFENPSQDLRFGPSYADDIFAVCATEIYTEGVKIPTLVYRSPEAKANPACADVLVKAITL
ncbi:Hypothetical protein R9X50_00517800 [Acrodontium crateriforme]|uniref:DUF7907 domain-containing protein n=1 Tax=Acrodontium crateriforme TaxID=150365 RepID=A0AAQ3R5P9_9PEZI|nr:Hypothetical protein R9X50_00517800 [Acrodontium crateriforme]